MLGRREGSARRYGALLLWVLLVPLLIASEAVAASAGCTSINAQFGSGFTASYDADDPDWGELYLEGLTLNAGEEIHYAVTSTGSTGSDPDYGGGGFGIFSANGQTTHVDVRSWLDHELAVSDTFVVTETRTDYVVYVWGAWELEEPATQVTATVTCTVDESLPSIAAISPERGTNPGGTPIIVTGTNLAGATMLTIGGEAASDLEVNEAGTEIKAKTPAGATGKADVEVVTPSGSGVLAEGFTYQAATIDLTPSKRDLPTGTVGEPYPPVTIAATGGTAPYTYTIWGWHELPEGLSLDPATGVISGTPTKATDTGFDIVATDLYGNVGEVYFTMSVGQFPAPTITRQPTDITVRKGGTATFTVEAEGATMYHWEVDIDGMGWADWGDESFGPNPYLVVDDVISQMDDMRVVVTAYNADYSNWTHSKVVRLKINRKPPVDLALSPAAGPLPQAMAGEAYRQTITAAGATGAVVYAVDEGELPPGLTLDRESGELAGPLAADSEGSYAFTIKATDTDANTGSASYTMTVETRKVTVTDKHQVVPAGTQPAAVWLEEGATGGPFTDAEIVFIEPAQAGQARLERRTATDEPAGWYLVFVPDATFAGDARLGFRLASDLGVSNTAAVTYAVGLDTAEVVRQSQALVRDFVRTRQSLIASTIGIPGLLDRRGAAASGPPVTADLEPSATGLALSFSTSLARLNASGAALDRMSGAGRSPFDLWIDGTVLLYDRSRDDERWGRFGMVSAGIDYLLTDRALVGFSVHLDRMDDPTGEDASLTGNGWVAGPYASLEIGNGVFWDTSLLHGGSANDIDTRFWDGSFDTRRWMVDTAVSGVWKLDDATRITPRLRAIYSSETVGDYAVADGSGTVVEVPGLESEQIRLSFGTEIERRFSLRDGAALTPRLGLTGGYSGLDGAGLFGSLSAGLSYRTPGYWQFTGSLRVGHEASGETSLGTRLGLSAGF
jgi:large repetitive protein